METIKQYIKESWYSMKSAVRTAVEESPEFSFWLVSITSLLSTAGLIIVGSYNLIMEPQLSDLLYHLGALMSTGIYLITKNF